MESSIKPISRFQRLACGKYADLTNLARDQHGEFLKTYKEAKLHTFDPSEIQSEIVINPEVFMCLFVPTHCVIVVNPTIFYLGPYTFKSPSQRCKTAIKKAKLNEQPNFRSRYCSASVREFKNHRLESLHQHLRRNEDNNSGVPKKTYTYC